MKQMYNQFNIFCHNTSSKQQHLECTSPPGQIVKNTLHWFTYCTVYAELKYQPRE